MRRLLRTIAILPLIVIVFVAMLIALLHTYSPIYKFREPTPFKGALIYNPYAGSDNVQWFKGNFHGHTRFDVDTTYTTADFTGAYRKAEYDIIGVSDHQHLNLEQGSRAGFIPTYEHGYNMANFHQGMIGTRAVSWYESPVMWLRWPYRELTASQMQRIFNHLGPQAEVVVFNHPERLRMVPDDLFGKLSGYDLWELNPDREQGAPLWDKALSSGHYAPMIANDDAHSFHNRNSWFQRSFTMVGARGIDSASVIDALKRGSSYGVRLSEALNTLETHRNFPRLQTIALVGDTITVTLDSMALHLDFIGQNGRLLRRVENSDSAAYTIAHSDNYVRIEAHYPDDMVLTLNPFARSRNGAAPVPVPAAQVEIMATVLNSLTWLIAALLLWMVLAWLGRRLKPRPRYQVYHRSF